MSEERMKALGARIQTLREADERTRNWLARKVKVSDMTIWRWETGERWPSTRHLGPIAAALGVSVAELLEEQT